MPPKTIRFVLWAKWGLFLLSLGWAGWLSYFIWGASRVLRVFPHAPGAVPPNFVALILDKGVFTSCFAPVIVTGIFLVLRWPNTRKAT